MRYEWILVEMLEQYRPYRLQVIPHACLRHLAIVFLTTLDDTLMLLEIALHISGNADRYVLVALNSSLDDLYDRDEISVSAMVIQVVVKQGVELKPSHQVFFLNHFLQFLMQLA